MDGVSGFQEGTPAGAWVGDRIDLLPLWQGPCDGVFYFLHTYYLLAATDYVQPTRTRQSVRTLLCLAAACFSGRRKARRWWARRSGSVAEARVRRL